ncbi:TonB-dependent receptor [Aestuariicella hydrocarbonica]|uniref:TonB-dependent receptor n=1 Tax=Pseudomaricurvus hydrocarbonicus TaxID=1470433 RepID=A0A9E5MPZ1_9GAMM|nr:TonB-dependent receptor [Aestuariicella hydrocarbonica]NHO68276.1 TonB-dependent receptor [Aestuariicella hydrocarbonica]
MNNRNLTSVMAAGVLSAAVSGVAQAQPATESAYTIEELVVTAQKREQSLQEVPIALSAFGSDAVKQLGASDFTGLTSATPGFSVSGGSGAFPSPYIRGIGSNVTSVGSDPSIGVYIDGVYAARKGGALSDLLDIERVEVLKGPQGTLFGRNSIGGAISIITAKPQNELSGMLGAEVGNYNNRAVKGMVNVPLIDETLLLRASGSVRKRDGWQENTMGGPDGDDRDRASGRVKLAWLPSDTVEVEFSSSWNRTDEVATYAESVLASAPVSDLTPITDDEKAVNGNLNPFTGMPDAAPNVPIFERTMRSHALNVNWDMTDDLTFTSLTAFRTYETSAAREYDGSEYFIANNEISTETNDTLSQEFRLNGISDKADWFVGVSASKETADMRWIIGLMDFLGANGGNPFYEDSFVTAETESYAIYGDYTWHATDKLNITLGARYSYDDKSINYDNPLQVNGAAGLGGYGIIMPIPGQFLDADGNPNNTQLSDNWSDFSPRVVVDYFVGDDAMVYASLTRGYKSGGFNTYPSVVQDFTSANFLMVLPEALESVDPETTVNLELGVKSSWMDERLVVNASVFAMEYDDLQVQVVNGQTVQLANAGKAISKGVETDVQFHVTPNLKLMLNAAWMDAEYDEFERGGIDYAGTPLRFSPKWTGSLGVDYSRPIADLGELRMFANYSYKDSHLLSETYEEGSYSLLNARVTFYSEGGAWEASLFGNNLTDESYLFNYVETVASFGFTSANRNEPRTYGAEFTYHF